MSSFDKKQRTVPANAITFREGAVETPLMGVAQNS